MYVDDVGLFSLRLPDYGLNSFKREIKRDYVLLDMNDQLH